MKFHHRYYQLLFFLGLLLNRLHILVHCFHQPVPLFHTTNAYLKYRLIQQQPVDVERDVQVKHPD